MKRSIGKEGGNLLITSWLWLVNYVDKRLRDVNVNDLCDIFKIGVIVWNSDVKSVEFVICFVEVWAEYRGWG